MAKKITTESWIAKAKEVHGDRYDYSKVVYTKSSEKVVIGCSIHGYFEQVAGSHTKGYGCNKCGNTSVADKSKMTTEEFVKKAREVHGNRYIYTKTVYESAHKKVTIKCPTHGEFEQVPNNHVKNASGCPKCGMENRTPKMTTQSFVEKASIVHQDKYTYEKAEYKGSFAKITITCPAHGDYEQMPASHLQGCGCPKCRGQGNANRGSTWSYSDWAEAGKVSSNFEGYSLYVIECSSKTTGERFIKVGKTYVGVANRFKQDMPYKYKVLTQVYHNAYAISKLEERIKRKFKDYAYQPSRTFGGQYECLSLDVKEEAVKMAEE